MATVRNSGTEPVWFRDDTGKRRLDPGASVEVTGDQHLAHVLSLPDVEVAHPQGDGEAPPTPPRRSTRQGGKEPADDPSAPSGGEAGDRP